MTALLIRLILLAGVALFLWWLLKPRYDFTLNVTGGDVRLTGAIAQAQRARIIDFFRDQIGLDGNLKVQGRRTRQGHLVLRFRGPLSTGAQQQIRNFLTSVL